MISGRGFKEYLFYFKNGNIKFGDNLMVKGNNRLEFYNVNEDGNLDWADIFTKSMLEKKKKSRGLEGDLEEIEPKDVLSRRSWCIKEKESCIKDFSDSEIFE